jgi:hypothetical protein
LGVVSRYLKRLDKRLVGVGFLLTLAFKCRADAIGAWHATIQVIRNGRRQLRAPVPKKQILQPVGGAPRRPPTWQPHTSLRNGVHQAVGLTVGTRGLLVQQQLLNVGLDFAFPTHVPAPLVGCQ